VRRITVTLQQDEIAALGALAEHERRDPRDQAAVLIRQGLEQRGLLRPKSEEEAALTISESGERGANKNGKEMEND
jgi:hypothetical protein